MSTSGARSAGPCPRCGIDQGVMLPDDAVATVRSLPRRWRSVLAVLVDDVEAGEDDDGPGGLDEGVVNQALARADGVRAQLTGLAEAARRIRVSDRPDVSDVSGEAVGSGDPPHDDPQRLLDALEGAGREAGEALDRLDGADWERRGRRGATEDTVLDLAREAAHYGVHELRLAEADLRSARGR